MCSEHTTNGDVRDYEIAIITWMDIEDRTSPGWVPISEAMRDAKEPFQPIVTAGIVLWEDDVRLSLTSSAGPDETSGALSLPKAVILSDQRYHISVKHVPPKDYVPSEAQRGRDEFD